MVIFQFANCQSQPDGFGERNMVYISGGLTFTFGERILVLNVFRWTEQKNDTDLPIFEGNFF